VGEFAFIFPSIDPNDGLACRRFAREIREVKFPDGKKYAITGTAIIRADLLNLTLPYLHKPIIVGAALILILTLLFYNRLSSALFTLAAPCLAFVWLLSLTRLFGIELSAYSSLAFPLLIGMSVDGSIQLWNAYYEKSTGSIHYIMNTTGVTVGIAQMTTLIGVYTLLMSSHPGLRSIGLISILGLLCITVSHLLVFPLIAGYLDSNRFRLRKKDH
jgi:predicted RND superfamily exporter protein